MRIWLGVAEGECAFGPVARRGEPLGGAVELTNEDVADILALLDSLPYDELDLATSRFRLTLRRAASGGWTQSRQETAEPRALDPAGGPTGGAPPRGNAAGRDRGAPAARDSAARDSAARDSAARDGEAGDDPGDHAGAGGPGADRGGAGLAEVTAPLPGTFYRAPRPGAAPFVEVGTQVSAATVVAIVETMKLMNSVHAGTAGRVAQILIGNGEPVAQGAALMRIEPPP